VAGSVFPTDADSVVTHLSQSEFLEKVAVTGDLIILDVRTTEEYADGHIAGAINIPHNKILANISLLDEYQDREVILYCRSGGRVKKVTDALEAEKLFDDGKLFRLQGDMQAWESAGQLIEK